ncbi:hypothetical protein L6452_04875 [Arctium lappa]|uniref:Uncharacterized protein n=1 Tax=Arctium lappa TaxID=4217 RepID=A0ACB9EEI8_ARCLA|nr:hypothetical protein L6452_04875 [Arctium lappa]
MPLKDIDRWQRKIWTPERLCSLERESHNCHYLLSLQSNLTTICDRLQNHLSLSKNLLLYHSKLVKIIG